MLSEGSHTKDLSLVHPSLESDTMNHLSDVLRVLDDALQLQGRSASFNAYTPLLGALPELDSMAVLALVTGLEAHFGITFSDDQLSGSRFATVGSLCALVRENLDSTAP